MHLLRELALTYLLLAGGADAFYGKKSAVVELNNKNFEKEILNSENAAVVEFFAPWCGHCKNLKPAYEKVAQSMKGLAKVAAIDCDEEKNKPTCGQYGIQGFPTLKIFRPTGKKGKPSVEDYNSARTAKAIADALAERIPNHITKVSADKLGDFLSKKNGTAKAILFTTKGKTGALWKSLAIDFLGAINFAQIRDKETDAVNAFGVTEFPKVIILPGGDAEGKVYGGKMEKEAMFKFFAAVKPPLPEPKASEKKGESGTSSSTSTHEPVATEQAKTEIPTLATKTDLQAACFSRKAKTCVLVIMGTPKDTEAPAEDVGTLTKVYKKVQHSGLSVTFQIYKVDPTSALARELIKDLELGEELPQLVIINHRGWFKRFSGIASSSSDVILWLDSVKLGEGKKEKIPESFYGEGEEEKASTKEKIKEKAEEIIEKLEEKLNADEETKENTKAKKEKVEPVEKENIKDEL